MEKKEKFLLNSRDQSSPEELKELQRLLEKEYSTRREEKEEFVPFYGDVTKLNVKGTILDLVGKDTLETMCSNAIQLLGTSLAIYEKDGDYAFGMFVSDWCRYMDEASRRLCNTDDNKEALANGKWLCHENCWNDSAKVAITTGKPTDIACIGGIRLYAEPIFARDKVIGAINIGYGNPPVDETGLKELAQKFRVPYQELLKQAKAYYPRPPFITTIAKKRLHNIATLIGKVVENVQNERKLHESEEQFKTITESSADAIFITDQKGNFVYVNQGAERLLGYTRRELLKKNNSDFYQPEDIGEFNVDFQNILKGKKILKEYNLIKKDGTLLTVDLNAILLPDGLVYASLRDISKRKQVEKNALESENRFRNLFNYMSSGVAIYEVKDNGRDFIFKDFNRAAENIEKIDKNKIIGKSVLAVFPQIKEFGLLKVLQIVNHTGMPQYHPVSLYQDERITGWRENYVFKLPSGEIVVIYDDVTERKKAEERLQESENNYRQLVETLNEGILKVDQGGYITFINPKMAEMLGYPEKAIKGKHIFNFVYERNIPYARKFLEKSQQGIMGQFEFTFCNKDSEPIYTLVSSSPIYDDGENYKGTIAGITDISLQKQAEIRLRKSLDGTINTLSKISETRDLYTAGHQERVTQLAAAIARELHLQTAKVEGIRIASLIHDIGKIGVPLEILSKPGRLNETEFRLVKEHPQIGYDILKDIDFPYPVAEIVLQHHEKLDGSGYPNHLKGPEIMIEAQILCVADVVEAISSHRPYRPALGIDIALEEIISGRGILFEPRVVDVCVGLFREGNFKFQ